MGRLKEALRPYYFVARRLGRGDLRLADLAWGQTSFSQFGEEGVLLQLFANQPRGFYVDVGAFDPFLASNTATLSRRGWRGINLEPDPSGFARMHRARVRDINLPLAVGAAPGQAEFVRNGLTSGLAGSTRLWAASAGESTIKVDVQPLSAILSEHLPAGTRIDLLDVDCEGHDLTVLMSNDWTRFRPRVIVAEWHGSAEDDIEAFLTSVGYRLFVRLSPSAIYVDSSDDAVDHPSP